MTELQEAALAVCNRWDSPDWSDGTHTLDYINRLRKAIDTAHGIPSNLICRDFKHIAFAKHDHTFTEGQKVKTRGDIGGFNLTIKQIHNDSFCTVTGYGKDRHMNMAFLEPIR